MAGGHDTRAAKRYATALFQAAQSAGSLDVVEKDIYNIMDLMRENPAFLDAWLSPLIAASRKRDLIAKILGNSLDKLTLSFLDLLIDKRREEVLPAIESEIRRPGGHRPPSCPRRGDFRRCAHAGRAGRPHTQPGAAHWGARSAPHRH